MRKSKKDTKNVKRYRQKKDERLVIQLPFILINTTFLIAQPETSGRLIGMLAGIAFLILFFTGICPTYYETTSSSLIVQSGTRHLVVPFISIRKVYPSHFVPGVKWPLNQLRVDYRLEKQSSSSPLFISPEDEATFLQDLAERARSLGIVIVPFG